MLIGTANPGRVSLLRVVTLPVDNCTKWVSSSQCTPGLLPSNTVSLCWLTEQITWGRISEPTLRADDTGPLEEKTPQTGYIYKNKQFIIKRVGKVTCTIKGFITKRYVQQGKQGLVRCSKRNTVIYWRDTGQHYADRILHNLNLC